MKQLSITLVVMLVSLFGLSASAQQNAGLSLINNETTGVLLDISSSSKVPAMSVYKQLTKGDASVKFAKKSKKRSSRRRSSSSSSSLSWLNGTWYYQGYFSSAFGTRELDETVRIRGNHITVIDNVDGFFDYSGTWSVSKLLNNSGSIEGICFGDCYFYLDRANHRFGISKGEWSHK